MTLTVDLENQGQPYTYVTFFISGCIHATGQVTLLGMLDQSSAFDVVDH